MKIAYLSPFLAAAAYFLPIESIEPIARILVPAIALMATGVFPCMTLVVNAMKGEQRTPALVETLFEQLKLLLKLLVVTFALAVAAVILLVAAVALVNSPVTELAPKLTGSAATLVIVLLAGRVGAIGRAFFTLLEINRKHALLISRAKVRGERDAALEAAKLARVPEDDPTPRKLRRAS